MAANPIQKILVIDDEPEIVEMIQNLLDMRGYESIATTEWTKAVDAAEHERPDLMLLDLNMPTIDGVSLLRFLREQGYTFPVVVVSGYIDDEIRASLIPLGVVGFVDKPFGIKHLSTVISTILSNQIPPEAQSPEDVPTTSQSPASESSSEPPPLVNQHNPGVLSPRREGRGNRARVMVPPSRKPSIFRYGMVQYFIIAVVCILLGGCLMIIVEHSQNVPFELYPTR
ncbi:MAG: CheY-like chemotaxis protein [Candidatus Latescibacterota bacterium]|jgi:CheY-like chemotaxis protein